MLHFTKTDARLANNGLPVEVQRLRCKANYKAVRFAPGIEALAKKIANILRRRGPFLVLHLRYEMDMIAFSGCNEGCTEEEIDELTKMRYDYVFVPSSSIGLSSIRREQLGSLALNQLSISKSNLEGIVLTRTAGDSVSVFCRYAYPWWKEKEIDSEKKRKDGLCPLTPEEVTLALRALDINGNIQVYIAAGDIYKSEKRMASLMAAYPNVVKINRVLHFYLGQHSESVACARFFISMD